MRRVPPIAWLLLSTLTVACATTGAGNARTTTGSVAPPAPAPAGYDTAPTPHPGDTAGELAAALAQRAGDGGYPLAPDGRLAELGRWAYAHQAEGALPAQSAIDAAAHHLGLVEPTPALLVYGAADLSRLPELVETDLLQLLAQRAMTHVGVFTQETDSGAEAVVVLSFRPLHMPPMPRERPPSPTLPLRGTLASELSDPELIVLRPDGTQTREALGAGPGFEANPALAGPGRYDIELLASGAHGLTVVANFPLFVGVPAPDRIALPERPARVAGPVDAALHGLVNRERQAHGLPPLERRQDLDGVARAHSEDMRAQGFVGHRSPTTGNVRDRVAAAGIEVPLSAENIGRAYDAAGLHAGWMGSPGHRANILHPRATHIGIGVVEQPEGEQTALLATQVFIGVPAHIDPEGTVTEGLAALGAARQSRGLPPLLEVPELREAARRGARRFMRDAQSTRDAIAAGVEAHIARARPPFAGFQTVIIVGDHINLAALDATLDPKATGIGVGLAQGSRPDFGAGLLTVAVVVLAYPE